MALALQYAVVAVIVIASAIHVLRSRAPTFTRRLCVALALPMVQASRPHWMQTLGRRIAPPTNAAAGCGSCDSGCASR